MLREFAVRFLEWVESAKLETSTKKYYNAGWALLAPTKLARMRMSQITPDDIEATRIVHQVKKGEKIISEECSGHYSNRALRTLKRMFSKAAEWRVIREQPRFKLVKAYGRDTKIGAETEKLLLETLSQPIKNKRNDRMRKNLRDVLLIAQDTGMRPSEIYRMRIENLDFANRQIWNPYGKTAKSRRFVPMSERLASMLAERCGAKKEGWVFPSPRSKSGHTTTIAKGFQSLRERAGLSKKLVLYSARHTWQLHLGCNRKHLCGGRLSGPRGLEIHGALPASRSRFVKRPTCATRIPHRFRSLVIFLVTLAKPARTRHQTKTSTN
jgi:integrase